MTPEQEKQWREEFVDLIMKTFTPETLRSDIAELVEKGSIFKNELSIYIEARKKAQEEIDGLKEQIASIKEIKQYPTALTYISELKEELSLERNFSSKFGIQSMKGYPTPKEWSELSSENMKTQQQMKRSK